jgi:hypothetical protein
MGSDRIVSLNEKLKIILVEEKKSRHKKKQTDVTI